MVAESAADLRGHRGECHLCGLGVESAIRLELLKRDGSEREAEELLVQAVDVRLEAREVDRPPVRCAHRGTGVRKGWSEAAGVGWMRRRASPAG